MTIDHWTRRRFVQTSAAVAAGGIVGSALGRQDGAPADRGELRVGLIGCGGRGTGAALQALRADPGAVLYALGDAFEDRVEACAGNLRGDERLRDRVVASEATRFAGLDAYERVIDSGVDVVILATPPVFRPLHLAYAIKRGAHVFCEKPVAVDAPGVRKVLELAREAQERKLALMSGFCWRYSLPQRAMYERLLDGQIGTIRAMQTTYNAGPLGDVPREPGETDMQWQLRNWKAFTWCSGDHIVEQAIHAIDWMNWAKGGVVPTKAWAVGGRQCRTGEWTGNMYDHFSVTYEWADGARGYHMCRQIANCDNDNTAYFMGSDGTCTSNPWGPRCIIDGANPWRYDGPRNDMYQTEHDELFASIRAGTPVNDGAYMAHSTMMGIMGRMAAYTGKTLTWEQCLNSQESLTPEDWSWDAPVPPSPVAMPGQTKFA